MLVTISATAPKCKVGVDEEGKEIFEAKTAEFNFTFPDTAEEMVEEYGDVVLNLAIKAAKIQAQSQMRNMLVNGRSPEEVSAYMSANWRPGIESRDPVTNFISLAKQMDKDQLQELLRQHGLLEE